MTAYLLDTGLVLRHLRGHQRTVQLLSGVGKMGRLSIASVTRLEVHAGMLPEERYPTQKLLARLATIDLDRDIADRAGDMIAASRKFKMHPPARERCTKYTQYVEILSTYFA